MTIGQRIAQKRKEQGLSQEALGDRLGVSRQSIYKWESDSALPEIDKLIALSRLFGVSVGWLLGVEEDAPPEDAAPEHDGELTETQLKMVEEIVNRYIAAQPKPKPRRWPWVLAGIALVLAGFSLFQRLDRMDQQYSSLQSAVSNVTYSVNSQIGSISNRVEEILKAQNHLTAEYGTELTQADLQENRAVFSVYAVPKTYVEGMTVEFSADNSAGGIQSIPGEEGINQRFSAAVSCDLTDSIALSVTFLYPDGTRQTQLLDQYEYLYSGSLPGMEVDDHDLMYLDVRKGQVQLTGIYFTTSQEYLAPVDSPIPQAAVAEIQVGLFKNQELVAWAVPCEKPSSFQGDWGSREFYRLPDMTLSVGPEDVLSVAALVTDEYGRSTVCLGFEYVLDQEDSQLTWGSSSGKSSDPADWGL